MAQMRGFVELVGAIGIFGGAVGLLVAMDEIAKRRWPEVRIKVLRYIGALPVVRR